MSETRPIAKRARQRRILAALRASNDLWIPGMVTALDDVRHMHAEGLARAQAPRPPRAPIRLLRTGRWRPSGSGWRPWP